MTSCLSWKATFCTLVALTLFMVGPVGFLWFCVNAALRPLSPPPLPPLSAQHDGLVVLTGGEERITVALRLLRDHPSLALLISGVDPRTHRQSLIASKMASFDPALLTHIILGHRAISTVGNARETAQWAQQRHLDHIILITSSYHMQRALLEFHHVAPSLTVTPYPVRASTFAHLWSKRTWRILLREYTKLLGALLRNHIHALQRPYDLTP